VPRQHHPRLDLHEQRGHLEEIADRIDVNLLQHREDLEVLLGDPRDGDLEHVQLMLPHEIEQQVQRACKRVELNAKSHGDTTAAG
jgi:hypothetical protein